MMSSRKGFLITPPHVQGGVKRSYPIILSNFSRPAPRNLKGDKRYLVVGFDTEYQRTTTPPKPGEGVEFDNEVLSYQYACMTVDADKAFEQQSWSGIIIPEGPGVEDRLTLSEFIRFAIGHGIAEFPDISIPNDVYLVAHFTRADIPGFKDFKDDEASRANLNLENIRNTFINVKQDIAVSLKGDDDPNSEVKLNVKVRDTITLAPTGKAKLDDLGAVLGFEKIKIHEDPSKELDLKRNMKSFMEGDWEAFRAYAIRDAEICTRYTDRMIHLYKRETGRFKLPITLTQIGVDLIREHWRSVGIDPLAIVGKEEVGARYFSKKHNRYVNTKKLVSKKHLHWVEDFITECYHGGRNEQFWFGPGFKDVWYDYDLTSAYPSAMALIGHPDWSKIRHLHSIEQVLFQKDHPDRYRYPADLVFAEVSFEFPDSVRYPCLPVRTENGLIFPRKGYSSTHISEIILAHKLGAKLGFEYGVEIDNERHGYSKGIERPFRAFTKSCIDRRKQSPKGSLENLFWKELVNSTYGKTAQGLRERRVYDLRDAETKRLEPSKITNPAYASYITAFCRGALSEIMNNLPSTVNVFSVTTDGFLTNATPSQMEKATSGVLCKYYKSARRFLAGTEEIYEVKHLIKQPLGWRTRGQSTILPSKKNDWKLTANPSEADNESMRYVLAKGGIKLAHILTKAEETREINKLFFDRDPGQKMSVKLGMGIRAMYEEGTDFVDRTMIKKLSMEYDWKRRPHYVGEGDVEIDGIDCKNHLFFSTKPWDSVDQFQKVRAYWEQYNLETPHCLKTLADYDDFKSYLDSKLSIEASMDDDEKVGTYIRKKNGLKHRIRQQVTIAWYLRKAGTHTLRYQAMGNEKLFPTAKLKAKDFASYLSTLLQIEISVSDVYNARKAKVFTPHQIPNTLETRSCLQEIKANLFPQLVIEEFLTKTGEFSIEGCALEDCSSSQKMLGDLSPQMA